MTRALSFVIMLFLMGGQALRAANPQDIEFQARLLKAQHVYHMGAPIEIELLYSSRAEKRFYGVFSAPSPDAHSVTPHVTPRDGVFNPRTLWPKHPVPGSRPGNSTYVGSQPVTQRLDLGEWCRFQKPGHYSVVVTSTEVSELKPAKEGGEMKRLTLESNPVKFEILPADPAWDAEQIRQITQELKTAGNRAGRKKALRRLVLLDTPASVRLLVRLYLTADNTKEESFLNAKLHESSHADVIIHLLTDALSNPASPIPLSLPELLAGLKTRKQMGVMPEYPHDAAGQGKRDKDELLRIMVHDTYLAQANSRLDASLDKRSGVLLADAIFQVWYDAVQLEKANTLAPANLPELQSAALAVAGELDPARLEQFVTLAWPSMPHERLQQLLRKLAEQGISHPLEHSGVTGFRLWCEGWHDECSEAILEAIVKTHARMSRGVIMMMKEEAQPRLDKMLEAQLRDPALAEDSMQSQRTATVVLRAGDPSLVPAVDLFLDRLAARGSCNGVARGNLLAYLFRVAPADAENRLTALLEDKNGSCGAETLRTLYWVHAQGLEDIVPIVTEALNFPNLRVEQKAALFLAYYGKKSSKKALWRRLQKLWGAWRDRASELQGQIAGLNITLSNQTATLERALASALVNAKNWKLNRRERKRLLAGCLTRGCRQVVQGEAYVNL